MESSQKLLAFLLMSGCCLFSADAAEVGVQTEMAAYRRLATSTLTVPVDWNWEWLPANAAKAKLTLESVSRGIHLEAELSDKSKDSITISDAFATSAPFLNDALTATLSFSNARGQESSRSFIYDLCESSFGLGAILHEGVPGDESWKRVQRGYFSVPFDLSWYGAGEEGAATLSLTQEGASLSKTIAASAGRFAFARKEVARGACSLELSSADVARDAAQVMLVPSGMLVVVR